MDRQVRRLHIGNISPKLADNVASFETRISKFGEVVAPLELHTKPVNDFFYGYISIKSSPAEYERLRAAFHGVVYMGRKLTVAEAKALFEDRWKKDHDRPDSTKKERAQREAIARARDARISEATTAYPVNPLSGHLVGTSTPQGFRLSAHTLNNASAQTKHKPPQQDLIGSQSYGSLTKARGVAHQAYSRTSGGGEVIKGRLRTTPRSKVYFLKKQQTLRTNINGDLKLIKAYKTKLWGVEKNKTAKDLTYLYHNGVWKSGDDHIVERVVRKCAISGADAESYGASVVSGEADVDDIDLEGERRKNVDVLASLFSKHDFDRPVELEDNGIDAADVVVDQKGRRSVKHYDFEVEGRQDEDDDQDSDSSFDYAALEQFKQTAQKPAEEVYYSEDDEGNELDLDALVPSLGEGAEESEEQQVVEDVPLAEEAEAEAEQAPVTNNTETLRSLFSGGGGFSLALDDDDIDETNVPDQEEQQKLLDQIKQKQAQSETAAVASSAAKFGLFWPHFDSPFLQTQSQLNKLGNPQETVQLEGESGLTASEILDDDETPYEKWFWQKRGELMRECKRRRRDVSRVFRKRNRPVV